MHRTRRARQTHFKPRNLSQASSYLDQPLISAGNCRFFFGCHQSFWHIWWLKQNRQLNTNPRIDVFPLNCYFCFSAAASWLLLALLDLFFCSPLSMPFCSTEWCAYNYNCSRTDIFYGVIRFARGNV